MLRVSANEYIGLGKALAEAEIVFVAVEAIRATDAAKSGSVTWTASASLDDSDRAQLREALTAAKKHCDALGLEIASMQLAGAVNDLPQSLRELNLVMKPAFYQLSTKLFFYIPVARAAFHELKQQQPPQLVQAFPVASEELKRAGNCYAFGAYTASVFHSMRAAEKGVHALAGFLSVSIPNQDLNLQDWETLLQQTEAKIKDIQNEPKTQARDEKQEFCSQAAAQFRYFKSGWRNLVSHIRKSYQEDEAREVLIHVQALLEHLSTKVTE